MKQDVQAYSGTHQEEYRLLGRNIAYYRKRRGMSQIELAEKLNISRTHMSNIEATGTSTAISLELLYCISDALQVPVYDLLDFQERQEEPTP